MSEIADFQHRIPILTKGSFAVIYYRAARFGTAVLCRADWLAHICRSRGLCDSILGPCAQRGRRDQSLIPDAQSDCARRREGDHAKFWWQYFRFLGNSCHSFSRHSKRILRRRRILTRCRAPQPRCALSSEAQYLTGAKPYEFRKLESGGRPAGSAPLDVFSITQNSLLTTVHRDVVLPSVVSA